MTLKKILLLSFIASILGLSINANAQDAPSEGCGILNGIDLAALNPISSILGGGPRNFFSGDTIVATVAPPTASGTPTGVQLEVDTIVVDSDGFPGSVTYVFPADGDFEVDLILNTLPAQATWTITCGQPPTPAAPAAPVPTMSVWALGVLIGLTGLIGFNRRRTK